MFKFEILDRNKNTIFPIAFLFIGMYFYIFNLLGKDLAYLPGDFGDGRLNNYFLEHCYLFLSGKVSSFWDAAFMYPEPKSLTFSDNLFGTSVFYYIPRLIGFGRETSFQLWFILIYTLNFICTWFVVNSWFKNSLLASLTAYLFTFTLISVPQLMHAQLFPKFPMVLGIYFLINFLKTGKISFALSFYFFLFFQFLCGMYLGIFLLYTAIVLFFSHIIFHNFIINFTELNKKSAVVYCIVFAIITVLFYYFLSPYYKRSVSSGYFPEKELIDNSPTFSSYFYVLKGTMIWDKLFVLASPNRELWNFSGVFILILTVSSFFVKTTVYEIKIARNALVLLFITTLKIGEFPLFLVLSKFIPGLGAIRVLSRISLVEMFFVGLLASWTLYHFSKNFSKLKLIIFFLASILLLIENKVDDFSLYRIPKIEVQNRITDIKNKVNFSTEKLKYKAFAYLAGPNPGNEYILNLDAMIYAQDIGLPSINAYTSRYPQHFEYFHYAMECSTLNNWLKNNGTDSTLKVSDLLILNQNEIDCR